MQRNHPFALIRVVFAVLISFGGIVTANPSTRALATQDDDPFSYDEPVVRTASQDAPLRPVRVTPDRGVVGTTFSVSVDGLSSGQVVEWDWQTWDGSYSTNPTSETVEYKRREFTERRYTMGQSTADADGTATTTLTAPEDYGEVHLVYAVTDGADVGRGGFRIQLSASISPSEGPVGTPVTIHVTGMAARLFSGSTLAVRWNNVFTGILTATTTGGTADGKIRAVGPVGQQYVVLGAGTVPPYLNIGQSPYDYVYSHLPNHEDIRLPFRVTTDPGPSPDTIDWPDPPHVAILAPDAQRTASSMVSVPGIEAELQPPSGPVLSRPTLAASGLEPGVDVQMWWVTARGNRVTPSGWNLADIQLPTASASSEGTLAAQITVPDDLGGWHVLKMAQSGRIVAEAPYFVERSLVDVSPRQVKNGDTVTIHVKGLGWTELDNGFAVTYDNSHIGYACGFNSDGDVVMQLLATGAPGTHLIDLYPMVYAGQDPKAWYWAPILTYADDFPALGLGYRLPAMRIAIQIL